MERRNIFRNSLVAIVKTHHVEFCKGIGIDLTKEGEVMPYAQTELTVSGLYLHIYISTYLLFYAAC